MPLPIAIPRSFEGFTVGGAVVAVNRDGYGRITKKHHGVVVAINEKTRRVSITSPTFKKASRRSYTIDGLNIAPADRPEELIL